MKQTHGTWNAVVVLSALMLGTVSRASAETYDLDLSHTGIIFRISHFGLSETFGRFNDASGQFTIDPKDPSKDSFALTIKADSIDSGNAQRDKHLTSPDFLNTKQFPAISFKSTAVKPVSGGLEVQGEFTLHGVTKPVTLVLKGGKTAELPAGVQRTGYTTEAKLKRSDFGIDKMLPNIGDEIAISVSFEGTVKK